LGGLDISNQVLTTGAVSLRHFSGLGLDLMPA
jgi:hypothetical protein